MVSTRAPKHTFTHNAHTNQGEIAWNASLSKLGKYQFYLISSSRRRNSVSPGFSLSASTWRADLSKSVFSCWEKPFLREKKKKYNPVHHQTSRKRDIRCKSISGYVFAARKIKKLYMQEQPCNMKVIRGHKKLKTDSDSKLSSYTLYLFQGKENLVHTPY